MTDFLIYPVERIDGRLALKIRRADTGDKDADNGPIELTNGVFEIEPDFETLCRLFEAISRALLARVR